MTDDVFVASETAGCVITKFPLQPKNRPSLMITLSSAAAITYDLMTPAAIGRHSGGAGTVSAALSPPGLPQG